MQKSLIILGPFALLWVASLFLLGHSQNQCFFAFDGPPREAWCGYMDLLFLGTSVAFTAGILFASYRAIMGGRSFRPIGLALILIGNALFATGWFALRLPMLITFFTDRSFFYERWESLSAITVPLTMMFGLTICVAAYCMWRGMRSWRNVLLIALVPVTILQCIESYSFASEVGRVGWERLTVGPRWVLWLILSYWFLQNAKAQAYFDMMGRVRQRC